jgi:hypothetical protein
MYMLRAPRGKYKRFRPNGKGAKNKQLRERLLKLKKRSEAWPLRHAKAIAEVEPDFPESFDDRQCDISEPLIIIASVLGGEWPKRIVDAITAAFGSVGAEDPSKGVLLLGHIRKVFLDKKGTRLFADEDKTRIFSKELLTALLDIPGAPWAQWSNGKDKPIGLTETGLSALLKKYQIRSTTVRVPGFEKPGKGYKEEDFKESFERLLRSVCQCKLDNGKECDCHEACNGTCNASENADSANDDAGCTV